MKEIIFNCPVCDHKTDLTGKDGYTSIHHKCENCNYPFTIQRDCSHNIVFMPRIYRNLEEKLICPHCKSDIRFDQDIEGCSCDFDFEWISWDELYRIDCPYCKKPFRFTIDRWVTYLNVSVDIDDFGDWWDLEQEKEEGNA